LNIASLLKHVDELKIYLEKEPLDILSINESRLDETISSEIVGIPGYDMIANSRNREGGGVAVYYRSILNVINREDLIPDNIEAICLEVIKPKSKPILITSVYRPPSSRIEYFEKIEILFQNLDSEHKELIIVGDFNCDLLKNNLSNHTKRLNEITNLFQMIQVIEHPTRITDSTATLLDVAIVSHPENILQSGVLHVGISDHSLIYICRKISFSLNSNHNKVIESRDYKSYLQQNFNQDLYAALSLVDWGTDEPNILWDNFKTTFNYVADIHAPTKVRKIRSRKSPWLTDAIKKNMNYRD
jgi:exonuclease III